MTILVICDWCGYINEKKVENDDENYHSACPCCNLDVVEIHEN